MSSLNAILHQTPWIPYNDTFYHSRMILTFPKNVIFTAQLLSHVQSLPVYKQYPHAERFEAKWLQNVDWKQSMIVFDDNSHVVMAPEPVMDLIQLDRRLQYKEAADGIFGSFRPMFLKKQWLWILGLVLGWILVNVFSTVAKRTPYRLVLSNPPTRS